jgi:hypothetical protein
MHKGSDRRGGQQQPVIQALLLCCLLACGGGDTGDSETRADSTPNRVDAAASPGTGAVDSVLSCLDRRDFKRLASKFAAPGRSAQQISDQIAIEQRAAIQEAFGDAPQPGNEAHDCQKLIMDGKYGPLVTLWVFHHFSATAPFRDTVIVGGLFREGGPNFDPLKIKNDRSCLLLAEINGHWKAWILPIDTSKSCKKGEFTFNDADSLNVFRMDQGIVGRPAAARWIDWGNGYYIGVQCGNRHWCVIGVPEPGVDPGNVPPAAKDGRGDHQRLGYMKGGLTVSGLTGTIEPRDDLEQLVQNPNNFASWTRVATIRLTGTDSAARAAYALKFRLGVASAPDSIEVQLIRMADGYHIRYNGGTGKLTDPIYHTPRKGASRWRWSVSDEGLWIQCPAGCCGDTYP